MEQEEYLVQGQFHVLVKGHKSQLQAGLVELFKKFETLGQSFFEFRYAVSLQCDAALQYSREALGRMAIRLGFSLCRRGLPGGLFGGRRGSWRIR